MSPKAQPKETSLSLTEVMFRTDQEGNMELALALALAVDFNPGVPTKGSKKGGSNCPGLCTSCRGNQTRCPFWTPYKWVLSNCSKNPGLVGTGCFLVEMLNCQEWVHFSLTSQDAEGFLGMQLVVSHRFMFRISFKVHCKRFAP